MCGKDCKSNEEICHRCSRCNSLHRMRPNCTTEVQEANILASWYRRESDSFCRLCNIDFLSTELLKRHKSSYRRFKCPGCVKITFEDCSGKRHFNMYDCSQCPYCETLINFNDINPAQSCNKSFVLEQLPPHIESIHNDSKLSQEKMAKCSYCKKFLCDMAEHLLTEHWCVYCQSYFSSMDQHKKSDHECSKCRYVCRSKTYLNAHMSAQHNSRENVLSDHDTLGHSMMKKVVNNSCRGTVQKVNGVIDNMASAGHVSKNNASPNQGCNKTLEQSPLHLESMHNDPTLSQQEKLAKCLFCEETTCDMEEHLLTVHWCVYCQIYFSSMDQHNKSDHKCSKCRAVYCNKTYLNAHMNAQHNFRQNRVSNHGSGDACLVVRERALKNKASPDQGLIGQTKQPSTDFAQGTSSSADVLSHRHVPEHVHTTSGVITNISRMVSEFGKDIKVLAKSSSYSAAPVANDIFSPYSKSVSANVSATNEKKQNNLSSVTTCSASAGFLERENMHDYVGHSVMEKVANNSCRGKVQKVNGVTGEGNMATAGHVSKNNASLDQGLIGKQTKQPPTGFTQGTSSSIHVSSHGRTHTTNGVITKMSSMVSEVGKDKKVIVKSSSSSAAPLANDMLNPYSKSVSAINVSAANETKQNNVPSVTTTCSANAGFLERENMHDYVAHSMMEKVVNNSCRGAIQKVNCVTGAGNMATAGHVSKNNASLDQDLIGKQTKQPPTGFTQSTSSSVHVSSHGRTHTTNGVITKMSSMVSEFGKDIKVLAKSSSSSAAPVANDMFNPCSKSVSANVSATNEKKQNNVASVTTCSASAGFLERENMHDYVGHSVMEKVVNNSCRGTVQKVNGVAGVGKMATAGHVSKNNASLNQNLIHVGKQTKQPSSGVTHGTSCGTHVSSHGGTHSTNGVITRMSSVVSEQFVSGIDKVPGKSSSTARAANDILNQHGIHITVSTFVSETNEMKQNNMANVRSVNPGLEDHRAWRTAERLTETSETCSEPSDSDFIWTDTKASCVVDNIHNEAGRTASETSEMSCSGPNESNRVRTDTKVPEIPVTDFVTVKFWTCDKCSIYAYGSTERVRHFDVKHRCILCRLFFLESDVVMKTVSGEVTQFAHAKCAVGYTRLHGDDCFLCLVCLKLFKSGCHPKWHLLSEQDFAITPQSPFQCVNCNANLTSRNHVRKHELVTVHCAFCKKRFETSVQLKNHWTERQMGICDNATFDFDMTVCLKLTSC